MRSFLAKLLDILVVIVWLITAVSLICIGLVILTVMAIPDIIVLIYRKVFKNDNR